MSLANDANERIIPNRNKGSLVVISNLNVNHYYLDSWNITYFAVSHQLSVNVQYQKDTRREENLMKYSIAIISRKALECGCFISFIWNVIACFTVPFSVEIHNLS